MRDFKPISSMSLVQLSQLCWVDYMNSVSQIRSILSQILEWGCTSLDLTFDTSIPVLFSLPLFLSKPSTCIENIFLTGVVASVHWTCPNPLKQVYLNLSPIIVTPKFFQMRSFIILTLLVLPHIHLNL